MKASQNMLMPPPVGGLTGASTLALIGKPFKIILTLKTFFYFHGSLLRRETDVFFSAHRPCGVGDYSSNLAGVGPGKATPMRTPLQEDVIMQEARNARILREMTPMTGQEVEELHEGTGFEGVAPRTAVRATPNTVLATPGRGVGGVGSTPARGGVPSASPAAVFQASNGGMGRTPLRDQFGLNDPHNIHGGFRGDDDSFSVSDVASTSWRDDREYRAQLAGQLKSLPEPEFAYEIAIPHVEGEDDDADARAKHMRGKPEDAAEVAEDLRRAREERELEELRRRSTVLKRGLPRPAGLTTEAAKLLCQSALSASAATPELMLASELVGKVGFLLR